MPVTSTSAGVLKTRGSRNVASTRYSLNPYPLPSAGLVEPDAARRQHHVARAQADAGEEVDRPVLAPQVAPADLEEATRRQLEPLLRLPAFAGRPQPGAALDAAADADRRGRRLLDLDEHVAPRLAGVPQLLDGDATEQPERGQALLALERAE